MTDHRLRVAAVQSSTDLRRCLPPGQADEHGDYDGDILTVSDQQGAEELVANYPNVTWVDDQPTDEPTERTIKRAEIGEDGVEHHCGVGGCERTVGSSTDTCWQHDEDED